MVLGVRGRVPRATRCPPIPTGRAAALYADERTPRDDASPEALWRVVEGIGGDSGWYSFPLAWAVARAGSTGWSAGSGLRRGRRDPHDLHVGEALDFWRVEEIERGRLLRLRAEMRVPGLAWLEFHVEHEDADGGHDRLRQRATFHPHGLLGHLYWWASPRSTASSSAACCATSPAPRNSAADRPRRCRLRPSWLTSRGPGSASTVSQDPDGQVT